MLDPRKLLAEEAAREPDPKKAAEALKLATRMAELGDAIDSLNEEIKALNAEYDSIRKSDLPDALHAAGMVAPNGKASLSLGDGRTVFLQSDMHVHLNSKDKDAFYDWLRRHKHADLIQDYVFPATMKAFAKEQLSNGVTLPDFIDVHPYLKAVLRKA